MVYMASEIWRGLNLEEGGNTSVSPSVCNPVTIHAGVDFRFNDRHTFNHTSIIMPIRPMKDDQWEGLESFTMNIIINNTETTEHYILVRTIYISDIDSK